MNSYLIHSRKALAITIITFLAMFLYSTEEKTESYYKANILTEDSDKDGIENYFDPCPYNEFAGADLNRNGCPSAKGLIADAHRRLEQINPICHTDECKHFKVKISGVKRKIKALADNKIIKNKEKYQDYIQTTIRQSTTELDMLCPEFKEECKETKETLASIIKEIKQYNAY